MTNDTKQQRDPFYYAIRTGGEGLSFLTREEAVTYAVRKHEETGADYTVARSLVDINALPEGGSSYLPQTAILSHYLVLRPQSPEGSVAFRSRGEAERDALMKCKRTGEEYQVLYTSERIYPNVVFVASVKLIDGKPVLESSPLIELPV